MQTDETYKSGLVLFGFNAYQWYLSVLRAEGRSEQAARHYERHRWAGALAPLSFYLHSHLLSAFPPDRLCLFVFIEHRVLRQCRIGVAQPADLANQK
jgi:hypothetical protein